MSTPETDPELEALPKPRRPWRIATLCALTVLIGASLWLASAALPLAHYALSSGQPTELGAVKRAELRAELENRWVHATGQLSSHAVGYQRPLDKDRFRLAPLEGRSDLWVEIREPAATRGEYFIPPESFVGRLVRFDAPGLRHRGVLDALRRSGQPLPPRDAWLLVDGDSPSATRWALGVMGLMLGFALFAIWGILTLLRPARG